MARDLYGRNTDGDLSVGDLATALKGPVKMVVETKSPGTEASINRLYDAVNAFAKKKDTNAGRDRDTDREWVKTLIGFSKSFHRGQKGKENKSVLSNGEAKSLQRMSEATSNLWKASQSQNTIWFGLSKLSTRAQHQIAESIRMANATAAISRAMPAVNNAATNAATNGVTNAVKNALQSMGRGGAGGGGGQGVGAGAFGDFADDMMAHGTGFWKHFLKTGLGVMQVINHYMMTAFDLHPLQQIFGGVLKDSNDFVENMRQIVHRTQGFGSENREIEDSYRRIYADASAAGVALGEYRRTWLRNLERGTAYDSDDLKMIGKRYGIEQREIKLRELGIRRMRSVQTSALHTAQALGMNTEATNEIFQDWHQQLSMSAMQLADMGRQMQNIARDTGISGTRLESALKNTDSLMKRMKSAGLASGDAAKNMVHMIALMEKHGVDERGMEMMKAMTSRSDFFAASNEIKTYLSRVASVGQHQLGQPNAISNMMNGINPQSPKLMKGVLQAMNEEAKMFLRQYKGDFSRLGMNVENIDLTKLSEMQQGLAKKAAAGGPGADAASRLVGVLDQMAKMRETSIGNMEAFARSAQEFGKTSQDRIAEITDRMKALQGKGLMNTGEFKRQERLLLEAKTNEFMDSFSVIQQELKAAGGNMAKAQDSIASRLSESMGDVRAKNFMGNIGGNIDEFVTMLDKRAAAEGQNFDAILKDNGITRKQLMDGLMSGDEYIGLILQQSIQKISQKERTAEDPVTQIREMFREANRLLGQIADSLRVALPAWLAQLMTVVGSISSILLGIAATIAAVKLGAGIMGMFGGRGGPAGGMPTGGPFGGGAPTPQPAAPGTGTVNPRGMPAGTANANQAAAAASQATTNFGGKGWSGAMGPQVTNPAKMRNAGATRAERIANAQKYMQARQLAGQTKGFGPMGAGYRRFAAQGKGFRGVLGRGANFLSRNRGRLGTAATTLGGAGLGYYMSEGNLLATGLGGLGGFLGGKKLFGKGKGLQAGGLDMAGDIGAQMMAGMQGAGGTGPVPVFIVGTDVPLGGSVATAGMAGIDMIESSLGNMQSTVQQLHGAAEVLEHAADASKVATARRAAGAVDVAEAGVGRMGKIRGVAAKGMELLTHGPGAAVGRMTGLVGSKIPGGAAALSKLGGVASKASHALGKVAVPLEIALSAFTGINEANEIGMNRGLGGALGVLTGGAKRTSQFAGALGLKEGSAADELLGVGTAAVHGASVGGTIGSVVPVVGTAIGSGVGAAVGGGTQLVRDFADPESALRKETVESWNKGFEGSGKALAETSMHTVQSFNKLMHGEFLGAFGESIQATLSQFKGLVGSISGTVGAIGSALTSAKDWITGTASSLWNKGTEMLTATKDAIGNVYTSAKETVGGVYTSAKETINQKAADAYNATGDALYSGWQKFSGLFGYANGTPKISTGGLAILHPGEMVLPASLSVGARGEAGGFSNIISTILGAAQSPMTQFATGLFGMLNDAYTKLGSISTKGVTSMLNRGAFENGEGRLAMEEDTNSRIKSMADLPIIQGIGSMLAGSLGGVMKNAAANMTMLGAFEKGEGKTALDSAIEGMTKKSSGDLNNVVSTALETRKENRRTNDVLAEVSRALYYEGEASEAANKHGEINTNLLDYTDDIKGEASTLALSRANVETMIERQRAGEIHSSSAVIPSMDSIDSYLNTIQAKKLDEMIALLSRIESNTSRTSRPQVIGANGQIPVHGGSKSSVKNIARDYTRGYWDLTFGDQSPGNVTTEGRGGSY